MKMAEETFYDESSAIFIAKKICNVMSVSEPEACWHGYGERRMAIMNEVHDIMIFADPLFCFYFIFFTAVDSISLIRHDIISGINRAKKEFSAFGIEVIIKLMTSLDPSEEIRIINDLTENGVSGMAVFPLDHPNVYALLNSLIEKGIAVITFNSPAPEVKSLCFIGQDHYKGGRTAAGLMCKILPKDARIGIIISSTKLSCHQQRLLGFQNKISETRPDIKIVGISENQDKKEDAFRITLEYCNKLPDLDGIYITGGGIAGVGSALDIIDDSENIHVICHDLTEGSIHLLQTQVVDFVLGQEPVNQGYLLIKTLFEYLVKNITPHKIIDIPVTISTDESYKKEEP